MDDKFIKAIKATEKRTAYTRHTNSHHNGGDDMTTKLTPVTRIPSYAVIIRAVWERGVVQIEALTELNRRGLWLSDAQKRQAGCEV